MELLTGGGQLRAGLVAHCLAPTNLDLWLTAPTLMVQGTSMGFRLGSSQHRADVLA